MGVPWESEWADMQGTVPGFVRAGQSGHVEGDGRDGGTVGL